MPIGKRIIGYYINAIAAHWRTPSEKYGYRIFIRNPDEAYARQEAERYMQAHYPAYWHITYSAAEPLYEETPHGA